MNNCNEPKPVFKVDTNESDAATVSFTVNGLRVDYDWTPITQATETATSIEVDSDERTFTYTGEDETYTISGGDLASIMHLAEIGDISASGVEAGSLLVYDADEAEWTVWNASANTSAVLTQLVGVNDGNTPVILNTPGTTSQYYLLGLAAGNKLCYHQVPIVASAPVDSSNKSYQVYLDNTTKQLVAVATS